VFVLPHQGSDTFRYLERGIDLIRENLHRYVEGTPLLNVVDPFR
jgi:lactate dehydrogenase-like 2-hydroxyacid dehydrogenase